MELSFVLSDAEFDGKLSGGELLLLEADETDIQRASAVRSTEGLIIHCLGKLTFALLLLNLYY